jgi:hypothetical protein
VLTDLVNQEEVNLLGGAVINMGMLPMGGKKESCATRTDMCPRGSRTLWAIHNAMMWVAWVILMAVILCSARYFRHYWRKSIYIHTIITGLAALLTVGGVIMAWKRNWDMSNKK